MHARLTLSIELFIIIFSLNKFLLATLLSWRLVVHGTREYPISPYSARIQLPSEPDRSSVSFYPSLYFDSSSSSKLSAHSFFLSIFLLTILFS
jgi:hypothetical protein